MEESILLTIENHFGNVTDPRVDRTKLHLLIDILVDLPPEYIPVTMLDRIAEFVKIELRPSPEPGVGSLENYVA